MRTIGLEETYATPKLIKAQAEAAQKVFGKLPEVNLQIEKINKQLIDIDQGRIEILDQAGIDVQVLSLYSAPVQLDDSAMMELSIDANDYLAKAVQKYPTRLAGFAALPMAFPEKAADELERRVKEDGFKGAIINGHVNGRYLDDEFFWPILERAQTLRVPIYLHPTIPPQPVIKASYTGNFSPEVSVILSRFAWGWHIETATHVLRIILSGAFDKYPNLQFIIGHMGEALPFMLPRIDDSLTEETTKLRHPISTYLRENIFYTLSGMTYYQTFLNLFLEVGADRIMFSTDYPFAHWDKVSSFLDQLPVSTADKEKIAHGNAERLLHM